jgi:hypothetical protein
VNARFEQFFHCNCSQIILLRLSLTVAWFA